MALLLMIAQMNNAHGGEDCGTNELGAWKAAAPPRHRGIEASVSPKPLNGCADLVTCCVTCVPSKRGAARRKFECS